MEFFNKTKYSKTGKYNGYSIVFFHGHNHSAFNYNYIYEDGVRKRKCYFLDYLQRLSTLFIYDRPEEMVRFNNTENKKTDFELYLKLIKKTNINWHCKNLNEFLKVKKVKLPYVLVAHSIGSLYAVKYAKMFPEQIKQVFILDPPQFIPSIARSVFSNKLSNIEITRLVVKLIKTPNNEKILRKLDYHAESIPYFLLNLDCPLYTFFNIDTNGDNKLTYMFNDLLTKLNTNNYQAIFYKNRDHYLNETNPLGIVNKIDTFIKSKKS